MIRATLPLTTLPVLAMLAGLPAVVACDGATAAEPAAADVAIDRVEGMVERLDLKNHEFTLKVGEERKTFQVDRSTLYYLDDKPSTRELVLVVGDTVTVKHTDGLAERIDGTTERS